MNIAWPRSLSNVARSLHSRRSSMVTSLAKSLSPHDSSATSPSGVGGGGGWARRECGLVKPRRSIWMNFTVPHCGEAKL